MMLMATLRFSMKLFQTWDVDCAPRSLTISSGNPKYGFFQVFGWGWKKCVTFFNFFEPGQNEILKLNHVKNKAHLAWQELRCFAILRYSRFLWFVNMRNMRM